MIRCRCARARATVLLAATAFLAIGCAHSAVAQDEENSRSVRIIDGPMIPVPPSPVKPPAANGSPDVLDQGNGESPIAPPQLPNIASPSLPPPAASVPVALPSNPVNSNPATVASPVLPNSAGLSVEMLPETTVSVGSRVWFRIASAKKAGYLILIDVDSNGKLKQIYPNPGSLIGELGKTNSNFLRPGKPIQIPSPIEPYAGFEFVVSPPLGPAMVMAILSDRPVQMVDLPDIPISIIGRGEAAEFVGKVAQELRIPTTRDDDIQLQQPIWSLAAKFYEIKKTAD